MHPRQTPEDRNGCGVIATGRFAQTAVFRTPGLGPSRPDYTFADSKPALSAKLKN
jgi:hypothetical protein